MQSRSAALTLGVICWIALGAAGFFLLDSEKLIASRRSEIRAFDQRARETARALGDLRSAQQAYVAAGQGADFWIPKVDALTTEASQAVEALATEAVGAEARLLISGAAGAIAEFGVADNRARDYLGSGLTLMAADVVFAEGGEAVALALRQLDAARLAALMEFDTSESRTRRTQAYVLAAAAGLTAVLVGVFVLGLSRPSTGISGGLSGQIAVADYDRAPLAREPDAEAPPRLSAPGLKAAAELCTELGRVNDPNDLAVLLGRAADMMDASGLVVWIGGAGSADLRAVLAHGYSPQTLARMPTVPRGADNATATAYRSGALQIVLARPGVSSGALVAPLLSPEGCIGALTAEIRGGGETSDIAQALAALVAAQLTSVVAPSALALPEAPEGRIASA
jgi:hypothetical protein